MHCPLNGLVVIVGLGKSGLSCVRYLAKQNCNIAVVDSRENPPGLDELRRSFPQIPLVLGRFDEDLLNKANEIILSPGISLQEPAIAAQRKRGVSVIGDIELFARKAKAPIVAITGSNGKSTVTSLVGEMAKAAGLRAQVGANLGTPALDLIKDLEPDLYVLELSSFQLETTHSLKPAAAVVLNVTPDHMDRYVDLAAYIKAKQLIYRGAKHAIINRDDPRSYAGLNLGTHVISFGLDVPNVCNFGYRDGYLVYGESKLIAGIELKIKGRHQIANALAALALGTALQFPLEAMLETLRDFGGLPHRCQWVRRLNDIDYYNDSKGTNVGATQAAISGLGAEISGKIILIAGGIGKGADFGVLYDVIKKHVRTMILIGRDAMQIATALQGCCEIIMAESMHDAVQKAYQFAHAKDVVLLSPACASMDMFENFEQRGRVFMEEVACLR